jgi:hypothetical protein
MSLADPAAGLPPTAAEQLPDDVATLKRMVLELLASCHEHRRDNGALPHRIDLLLRRLYGPRGERFDPNQLLLFAEIAAGQDTAAPTEPVPPGKPKRRCRPHGRRRLPENLPRQPRQHQLSEAERVCRDCGQVRIDIFTVNRQRDGPEQFLANYQGYLHADAFSGYHGLYLPDPRTAAARIMEVACNAHARRKFYEARGSDALRSHQALAYYRQLYELGRQAKDFSDAQRLQIRQDLAVPILAQFRQWLEGSAAGGAAQEPAGAGDRLGAEQRGGAGALHRGRLPGHRQQRGRARDEAASHWSQKLVDGRIAARRPDGGGAVRLHVHVPAVGCRAVGVPARHADAVAGVPGGTAR